MIEQSITQSQSDWVNHEWRMQTARTEPTYEIFTYKANRPTKRVTRQKQKMGSTTVITAYCNNKEKHEPVNTF
jgi:hypothetical protein